MTSVLNSGGPHNNRRKSANVFGISWRPHSSGNPLLTNTLSVDISSRSSFTDSDPLIEPEEQLEQNNNASPGTRSTID